VAKWPLKQGECGRKAKDASKTDRRDHYEAQAEVWRQLAEQVEANDKNVFGSEPK
jgi:3-deoxy-D-arabino-heptulosonate 7-phosphate (DAHP) synthase